MPRYTSPETIVNPTVITSNDWNKYFGSDGNLQWTYDSYANVSAIDAVSLENAYVPAAAIATVSRVINYGNVRGNSAYGNRVSGVLTSPVNTGYVYLTASVSHTLSTGGASNTPLYYIQFVPLHESHLLLSTSFVSLKRRIDTNNAIYPVVKMGSTSAIYYVRGGFTRFQLAVYREDAAILDTTFFVNQFSILPLGDVSGLVNFIDNAVVIE